MSLSEFRPQNDFERVLSETQQVALDIPDLIDTLSPSILHIPTRSAAQPGDEEFLPQLLPDGYHYSVVTFPPGLVRLSIAMLEGICWRLMGVS